MQARVIGWRSAAAAITSSHPPARSSKALGADPQCSRDRGDQGRRPSRPPGRDRLSGAEQPIQHARAHLGHPVRLTSAWISRAPADQNSPDPRKPAEVCRLDQSEPMPPAFRAAQQPVIQRTQASGHPCQTRSMSPPLPLRQSSMTAVSGGSARGPGGRSSGSSSIGPGRNQRSSSDASSSPSAS